MNLFLSKYAHLFQSSNGRFLVYNATTNVFLELPKGLYTDLLSAKNAAFDSHKHETSIDYLRECKILVTDNTDDDYFLVEHLKSNMLLYNNTHLNLVIVPTSGCNFSCPYCFEPNKQEIYMTDDVISELIQFIERRDSSKSLSLTWYGGEPLMAMPQIKKILERVEKMDGKKIVSHSLITNGYLLDKKTSDYFASHSPLSSIQITFDGNKESHNATRATKDDQNTFDQILDNITFFAQKNKTTKISIRVNISKSNKEDFVIMYNFLQNRFRTFLDRLYVYPGYIRLDDNDGKSSSCEMMQQKDAADFYFSMYDEHKIPVSFYPRLAQKGCSANALNSFIIGPVGEVYKCWNDVTNEEKIVGYIQEPQFRNSKLLAKYMIGTNPFLNTKCKQCSIFPICSGGCAWYSYRNNYEKGKFSICSIYKNKTTLSKALDYYYLSLNHK